MAPNVLSLADRIADRSARSDWTNTELAELYRVEHALVQARISIETDRGITDEGDPWFVFCRADGEVVVHVTRFGGLYRLFSPALPQPLVGPTFSALTKTFLEGLRTPIKPQQGVLIHPAALLSVLIAAIFFSIDFHSNAAHAAEAVEHGAPEQQPSAQLAHVPAKDTAFHALVANLKAFIDSVTPWDSEQSALLATVENAAVTAMSSLAGLAESVMIVSPVTPVLAETPGSQGGDPFWLNDLKTSGGPQADLRALSNRSSILTWHQDGSQSSVIKNSDLTWQGNHFVPLASATPVDNAQVTAPSAALQTNEDAQQGLVPMAAENPLFLVARASVDTPSAGNGAIDDPNVTPSVDKAIQVNLVEGSTMALSMASGVAKIDVVGNGALQISGISGTPQIDVSANSTQTLNLIFSAKAVPAVTIQLGGHDVVKLAALSTDAAAPTASSGTGGSNGAASVNLTLDSEGNSANNVTIADNAVSSTTKLNITVEGVQDLTLNESAQTFNNSSINSANLTGALTVSLDLENVFQSVDLSQVSAANFIVGDSGNIALLNAASGSHIQLGSDLNIVDLSVAGASAESPGALAVDLQNSATTPAPIGVNTLDAFSTASLTIDSTGAGAGGSNTIATLTDSSLTTLTITGDSGLTISAINGPSSADAQAITIDAHALTGSLVLDASGIADTVNFGRSITIIAGAGTSVLTNDTVSESTTFVGSLGRMIVNIGDGATNDSIVGLTSTDSVTVGTATHTDVVIDETSLGSAQQAAIDHQANVTAAAELAASSAASTAAHQALLFDYNGSLYVFIDVSGNHTFDASADAVVKLVGLTATANLAGIFHSG